jgi:hypothetical protein
VRGEHDRGAVGLERADELPELPPRLGVEARGRFVEEEQLRPSDDPERDIHPATLPAGELADAGSRLLLQADGLDDFADEPDAVVAADGASWSLADPASDGSASGERVGTTVRVRAAGAADRVARFVTDLEVAGAPVRRIEVASATLDDVFLELTGRSLRESNEQTSDQTTDQANDQRDESKGEAA